MKLTVEVPDDISSEEIEELVKRYVERKEKYKEFYKLVEGVDWNELKEEFREFRKTFKLRFTD